MDERELLLLLAAKPYGPPIEQDFGETCAVVLSRALWSAGLLNDRMADDIRTDRANPTVADWYATLIQMSSRSPNQDILIEVQRHPESRSDSPAGPNNTVCRLTDRGRATVRERPWSSPLQAERLLRTETDWAACEDPLPMLELVRQQKGEQHQKTRRKIQLFAYACCTPFHDMLGQECRAALEASAGYADGVVSFTAFLIAWEAAATTGRSDRSYESVEKHRCSTMAITACNPAVWKTIARLSHMLLSRDAPQSKPVRTAQQQVALLRDLFDNPFRSSEVNRDWLIWNGNTIPNLARSIYDDRAFDRLPILADALEEAGCTDAAILDHCRRPGTHAQGCWPVDQILDKQ